MNENPITISNEAAENIRAAPESKIVGELKDDSKLVPVTGGSNKPVMTFDVSKGDNLVKNIG